MENFDYTPEDAYEKALKINDFKAFSYSRKADVSKHVIKPNILKGFMGKLKYRWHIF